jgi:hypothetical protein
MRQTALLPFGIFRPKNSTASNPRSRIPEASMLTTRPPKPLKMGHSVPKRRLLNTTRRGTTQKITRKDKTYVDQQGIHQHDGKKKKKEYYLLTTALLLCVPSLLTPTSQFNFCFCRLFFYLKSSTEQSRSHHKLTRV